MCVGAVVVVNNRPVSIGYNGAPSGKPHCTEVGCLITSPDGGCQRTTHAEINALDFAHMIDAVRKTLYVTLSPCMECAAEIIERGVTEVYFDVTYRDTMPVVHLMDKGVKVCRVLPNGYIIDGQTGDLIEAD